MNFWLRLGAALLAGMLCLQAWADPTADDALGASQAWDRPGHGLRSIWIGYESTQVEGAYRRDQRFNGDQAGRTYSDALELGIEYGINERWSLSASLPYIRRRYEGPMPHNPAILAPPDNNAPSLDNGKYHQLPGLPVRRSLPARIRRVFRQSLHGRVPA